MDFVSIDVSQLPPGTPLAVQIGIRNAFYDAERFWEARMIGFSAQLPTFVQRQLTKIQITAAVSPIDGPGGIAGQAGPTQLFSYTGRRPYVVAQAGNMAFDTDDSVALYNLGLFDDVVRHEMAHVFGFGTLWDDNLLNLAPLGNYTGAYALNKYRTEARRPNATFVPVEQLGGPGTAFSHWDSADSFFFNPARNSGDTMIGFVTDIPFTRETTWAAMADLWFKVKGINDTVSGSVPGTGGPRRTPASLNSIPEPSHVVLTGLVLAGGLFLRRRRKK